MHRKISAIIAILFFLVSASLAQDIKGVWVGAFEADDVLAAMRLNFDDGKIVLSFAGDERPGAIKDFQITGGEVSFTGDFRPETRFAGKLGGDKIVGTFDIFRSNGSKSGSGVWSVRKVDSANFTDDSKTIATNEKIELPKPPGKFSIGRKFFYWIDESRAETITDDAGDKRKLFVQIWYPAKRGGKNAAEYYPNLEELRGKSE